MQAQDICQTIWNAVKLPAAQLHALYSRFLDIPLTRLSMGEPPDIERTEVFHGKPPARKVSRPKAVKRMSTLGRGDSTPRVLTPSLTDNKVNEKEMAASFLQYW